MSYLVIIKLTAFSGNLLDFPFNVEIWGTVSDWVMVIVTAVTFFFIYKAFQQQQSLLYYENIRFKLFIKPVLILEFKSKMKSLNKKGAFISFSLKCNNHKMYLSKIEIQPKQINLDSDEVIFDFKGFLEVDEPYFFSYPFLEFEKFYTDELISSSTIKVYYSDIFKNQYVQEFYIVHSPEIKINTLHSEEVNSEPSKKNNAHKYNII